MKNDKTGLSILKIMIGYCSQQPNTLLVEMFSLNFLAYGLLYTDERNKRAHFASLLPENICLVLSSLIGTSVSSHSSS